MSGISPLVDRSHIRTWIVCASGPRWLTVSRRFALELFPANLTANLIAVDPPGIRSQLVGQRKAVVFWEITPSCASIVLDHVTKISLANPSVMQIAATSDLGDRGKFALSELGIRAMIETPEQLPSLSALVHRYFAS